jgi:hypothetical protein
MLKIIVFFLILVLVILFVVYFYVETQRKKVKEENKKAITLRVTTMKNNFKVDVNRLVKQEILMKTAHEPIYRIANNFFVFQSVAIKNVDYCEQLLKNVINAMPNGDIDSINFDFAQEQISLFVRSLPAAASGYNITFYYNELPKLIKQLADSQENMYKIENENSTIKLQELVSATVD